MSSVLVAVGSGLVTVFICWGRCWGLVVDTVVAQRLEVVVVVGNEGGWVERAVAVLG